MFYRLFTFHSQLKNKAIMLSVFLFLVFERPHNLSQLLVIYFKKEKLAKMTIN